MTTDASESIGLDVKRFDFSPVRQGFDVMIREGAIEREIANSLGVTSVSVPCVVAVEWPWLRS